MLDFHNHLVPGVDDGAADISESRDGLNTLRGHGVRHIITTPHFAASVTLKTDDLARNLAAQDAGWESLSRLVTAEFPDMTIYRGVELMLDVPKPDLGDPRLRLADTSFVLVEFPFMSLPPHSTSAIRDIARNGIIPVIAHPERYSGMANNYRLLEGWKDAGALIQVNSGSLLGYYGSSARKLAWQILGDGCADYLSSDYHSRGKCPIAECARLMGENGAEEEHRLLTLINPHKLVANERPLPVGPVADRRPGWKKFISWN